MGLTAHDHATVQRQTMASRNDAARRQRQTDTTILTACDLDGRTATIAVSRSEPGRAWVLSRTAAGRLVCPCPGFTWRGRCRHIEAAERAATAHQEGAA